MRVVSSFWVSALVRRCFAAGAMATIARRGANEAGAIFIKVNRLDGSADLHSPAPQSFFDDSGSMDRRFECVLEAVAEREVDDRLDQEARFDSDIWIVEIEDRQGRAFLE